MKALFRTTVVSLALLVSAGTHANTITISDSWGATNSAAASRPLFFGPPPSTCAAPQPYAGANSGGPFFYDAFTFFNDGPATCVSVSFVANAGNSLAMAAYGGGFDPSSPGTDFVADSSFGGSFGTFSFNVAADSTFQLVAYGFDSGATGTYSFSVEGDTISRVPEPAGLALLGLGLAGLGYSRRKR